MPFSFTFDPRKKGLRQVLGDLEADIMEAIWEHEEVTVRDIHQHLNNKRKIAYTTVMTVMTRLADKGILTRLKAGSAHRYKPAVSREEFTESAVQKIMGKLLEDFTTPTLSQFVDFIETEDPDKMDELAKLIEKKRQKND